MGRSSAVSSVQSHILCHAAPPDAGAATIKVYPSRTRRSPFVARSPPCFVIRIVVFSFGRAFDTRLVLFEQRVGVQPQDASGNCWINSNLLPPRPFIAGAVDLAMMAAAHGNCELVADLLSEGSALREAKMVSIRRPQD